MSRCQPSRKIIQARITGNAATTLLNKLLVRDNLRSNPRLTQFARRRGSREVSSGEVCSWKRVEAVNSVSKYRQGAPTADRWRRSSAPRRSGQPTAQRSHLSAASRVFVCATEIGATSPNLTYWLSPERICIQSGGGERKGQWRGRDGPIANIP